VCTPLSTKTKLGKKFKKVKIHNHFQILAKDPSFLLLATLSMDVNEVERGYGVLPHSPPRHSNCPPFSISVRKNFFLSVLIPTFLAEFH
jgi:hypothetical protein